MSPPSSHHLRRLDSSSSNSGDSYKYLALLVLVLVPCASIAYWLWQRWRASEEQVKAYLKLRNDESEKIKKLEAQIVAGQVQLKQSAERVNTAEGNLHAEQKTVEKLQGDIARLKQEKIDAEAAFAARSAAAARKRALENSQKDLIAEALAGRISRTEGDFDPIVLEQPEEKMFILKVGEVVAQTPSGVAESLGSGIVATGLGMHSVTVNTGKGIHTGAVATGAGLVVAGMATGEGLVTAGAATQSGLVMAGAGLQSAVASTGEGISAIVTAIPVPFVSTDSEAGARDQGVSEGDRATTAAASEGHDFSVPRSSESTESKRDAVAKAMAVARDLAAKNSAGAKKSDAASELD